VFWLLVRRMISDAACDFLIQPLANDGRGRLNGKRDARATRPKHLLLAKEKVDQLTCSPSSVGSRFIIFFVVASPTARLFFCFRKSPLVAYLQTCRSVPTGGKNGHLKVAGLQFFPVNNGQRGKVKVLLR
jgi:hypothetical protein